MIDLVAQRKENAQKMSEVNKSRKLHDKKLTDHKKRLSEIISLQQQTDEKIQSFEHSITETIVSGGDAKGIQTALENQKLNLDAYRNARAALKCAVAAEEKVLYDIDHELQLLDRSEKTARLVDATRAYNKQAQDLAKTLYTIHDLIESLGGSDKIQIVRCAGTPSGVNQILLAAILPKAFEADDTIPQNEKSWYHFNSKHISKEN